MERLTLLLERLGAKEAHIARSLHWAGITGRRQSTSACPIAQYVRLYHDDAFDVVVTPQCVSVWKHTDDLPRVMEAADTPASIRDFIIAFDHGKYPRLDEHAGAFEREAEEQTIPPAPLELFQPHSRRSFII